jgi:hypothetical protein
MTTSDTKREIRMPIEGEASLALPCMHVGCVCVCVCVCVYACVCWRKVDTRRLLMTI